MDKSIGIRKIIYSPRFKSWAISWIIKKSLIVKKSWAIKLSWIIWKSLDSWRKNQIRMANKPIGLYVIWGDRGIIGIVKENG